MPTPSAPAPPPPAPPAEWSTPPAVRRPSSSLPVLLLPVKCALGFCFTAFLFALLAPLVPFLLLYRLLEYIRFKLVLPISCDVLWPRPPITRGFIWLSKQASLDSISAVLNSQPSSPNVLCFPATPLSQVEVTQWDHERSPLRTHEDLVTYVKAKLNHIPYAVQVKVVLGFEDNSMGRTLLAVKTHPDSFPLCMARILSALSQGNVTVEVEPRVFHECSVGPNQRLKCVRRALSTAGRFLETFSFGPLGLLMVLQLKPEKVWRALVAESHQVFTYRRRPSLLHGTDDSETSRLCINSSVQLRQETTASFSITEIGDVDELQKVERLLRATMPELLTSFLAGALRRYFRASDPPVLHPPDCMAAFSVCSHASSMCKASSPCDNLLLPISLPIGVEGRIPRLWSLQRQFSELDERSTPDAMRAFNAISRTLLTRQAHSRVASVFFRHSIINVAFLRVRGDVMLDANLLTGFIPVPPLSLPSRASFIFVQHRDRLLLVSSIDRGLFDKHADIFKYMKDEQRGLLDHLSFRLKTLAQTCVLPDRLPSEERAAAGGGGRGQEEAGAAADDDPAAPYAPQNSPSGDHDDAPGPSSSSSSAPHRRASMADLSELLREVQDELDEMRRNPNTEDRDETIRRLRELEAKIETFHNGMKSELWGNTVWVRQERDEAMAKVAELLAPYKRRVSVSGRKLSVRAAKEYANLRRGSKDISTRRASSDTTTTTRREEESRSQRSSEELKGSEEREEEETQVEVVDEERKEEEKAEREKPKEEPSSDL